MVSEPEILIVDDAEFMRNLLKDILEDEFDVIGTVENGTEAVKACKDKDPDVVMMDVVMPETDGIEATSAIVKSDDTNASVIMVTSVSQRPRMKLAAEAGAVNYVTKPFDNENVVDVVKGIVEE